MCKVVVRWWVVDVMVGYEGVRPRSVRNGWIRESLVGIEGSTEIGFLWVRTMGLYLDIHRGDCRGGDGD